MVDTIAANIFTTGNIGLGRSVYGEVDTNGDHDWYRIDLTAGTTYEFRLHGIGPDQVADPTLAVRSFDGTQLAFNDDAGATQWDGANNRDSFVQFTATTSGQYYLNVGEFGSDATGEFLLTAVVDNPLGMVFTVDEIAWQIQNNYNEAPIGGGNTRQFIWNDATNGGLTVNITALDADGQFLARNALQAWTLVSGVRFTEVSTGGQIVFDDNEAGEVARANWSHDGSFITSATVQMSRGWLDRFGTGFGSYSFETYIHEIGHALGLGHGGNYDGEAVYGTDNLYRNDSVAYSIMSYMQARNDEFGEAGDVNTFVDASFRFMLTPAMADIIAIQNMYQSQQVTIGDTTYGFNSNTGNAAIDSFVTIGSGGADSFMCIWDEGGNDTLDFSGQTNPNLSQQIFLEAESFSNVLGGAMNVSIARGVEIENAFSGAGNDTLVGNALTNTLRGGGGNDFLIGGSGQDFLIGEGGNDRFQLIAIHTGDVNEIYRGGLGTDRIQLFGFSSYTHNLRDDTLDSIEEIELTYPGDFQTSRVEIDASQIAVGAFAPTGSVIGEIFDEVTDVFAVYLTTTTSVSLGSMPFFNFLNPNDRIELFGDVSDETIIASGVRDVVAAGGGNDTIYSFAGNDTIDGEGGNDRIYADFGDDSYIGGAGNDTVDFSNAFGPITFPLTVNLALAGAQNTGNGFDTFTGIENLVGNSLADTFTGDSFGNVLDGAGGNDTLAGGAGNDRLDGGAGSDTANFSSAAIGVTVNLQLTGAQNTGQGFDTLASIENLIGTGVADRLTGNSYDNRLEGFGGNDMLVGGLGADRYDGGAGNDTVDFAAAAYGVYVNLAVATAQNTSQGLDTFVSIENLFGSAYNDTLLGDSAVNQFSGGDGNDTLRGEGGMDALYGAIGNDRLFGGSESDLLEGGAGNDRMDGGLGADRLYANYAGDTFVFTNNTATGSDRCYNFVTGVTKLEFAISAFGGTAGAFALQANANPNPLNATQAFLFDTDNGYLYFDRDGTGAAGRVLAAQLFYPGGGVPALVAGDIVLV